MAWANAAQAMTDDSDATCLAMLLSASKYIVSEWALSTWARGWRPCQSHAWWLVGGMAPLQTVCVVIAGAGHPCMGGMEFSAKVQEATLVLLLKRQQISCPKEL